MPDGSIGAEVASLQGIALRTGDQTPPAGKRPSIAGYFTEALPACKGYLNPLCYKA